MVANCNKYFVKMKFKSQKRLKHKIKNDMIKKKRKRRRKMKKCYTIVIALMVIAIIVGTIIFTNTRKTNQEANENENRIENSENVIQNVEEIEEIKNEINATANTNIYKVEEESDGRKILQVKPEVQFEVDLAGIIKNAKPDENELQSLIEKASKTNGVWIAKQSRENFLELLKKNGIENFSITDEGYLKRDGDSINELAKSLQNMLNANKLYIINMTGIAYERDYISGEIVEYPFEDMDPFQIVEPYQQNNKIILEITSNKRQKLTDKEILETIVQY